MNKGIDSLAGVARNQLGKNPLSGSVYIFINKSHNQLKMLHWQKDGFAVYYKRLERGTYELPLFKGDSNGQSISLKQILFLLQGIQLKSIRKNTDIHRKM